MGLVNIRNASVRSVFNLQVRNLNTKQLKWLSYLTFGVMFFATFGGTVVTKTASGLGCGHEWPLCHGQFIPAHTVASLIEYSHRLVSGLAGLTAVAVVVAFWLYAKNRKDLRMYSVLTLIFVIVQAIMGALAVVYDQSSAVLALHFGFSLIAFAKASNRNSWFFWGTSRDVLIKTNLLSRHISFLL